MLAFYICLQKMGGHLPPLPPQVPPPMLNTAAIIIKVLCNVTVTRFCVGVQHSWMPRSCRQIFHWSSSIFSAGALLRVPMGKLTALPQTP